MTPDDDAPDDSPDDDPFTDPLEIAAGPDPAAAAARLGAMVAAGRGGARARRAHAIALARAGEQVEAVARLREAAFLDPQDAAVRTALGTLLLRQGEHREAIAVLQHALRLGPADPEPAFRLGEVWEALGERERAAGFYDEAAAADGDPFGAAARAAAMRTAAAPDRHTPDFVRHLFDGYAATYDSDMRGTLAYRGPEILLDALADRLGPPIGAFDAADLGCGTGLCGPVFRPWLRRLEGVDLSPAMLARAAERGVYDALHQADLVGWLEERPGAFNLLLAADVLNYLGDLRPAFAAAACALRPSGLFGFSVEAAPDADAPDAGTSGGGMSGEGWSLGPKRRFRHGRAYVAETLAAAGLRPERIAPAVPRREAGEPVAALVVVARAERKRQR